MNALPKILKKHPVYVALASNVRPDAAELGASEYGRLIAMMESLRLALQFYADGDNWKGNNNSPAEVDRGERARTLLELLEEE